MKTVILLIFTILLFVTLLGGSFIFWQEKFTASPVLSNVLPIASNVVEEQTVLLFVGDIMLDRGVEFYIQQHDDWRWPFLNVKDIFQKADLVFGNLESVISDKGEKVGSMYSFRADPKTMEGLVFSGIDVVSVANNHSIDYGPEAFVDSLERLKEAGIDYVGGGVTRNEAETVVVKVIKGTTIGIIAYSTKGSPLWQAGENSPGISWMDSTRLSQLKKDIEVAKENVDILVVSFHFGEEYQKEPSMTQQILSKAAIDAGADFIIGHHSHVVQPVEQYKDSWIAYGLGNFIFDQNFSPDTMEGLVLKVEVEKQGIVNVIPLRVNISKESQPTILIK
ncbi:MAG: CapA family protein [Patescibacteria group bacterium]|nr:CapA family protein [Patescibacteria group bacterium]